MAPTKKQTSADEDQVTTSEQNPEIKEASDSPSRTEGTWEEPADPVEELDQKLVIADGEVKEVATEDFVQALNSAPTEQQNPVNKIPQAQEGVVGQDFFGPDDDWKATVLGEEPEGGTIQVMKQKTNNGYYLAYREGLRSVPKEIEGWYTSYDRAEQAGRNYLNKLWDQQSATSADA